MKIELERVMFKDNAYGYAPQAGSTLSRNIDSKTVEMNYDSELRLILMVNKSDKREYLVPVEAVSQMYPVKGWRQAQPQQGQRR